MRCVYTVHVYEYCINRLVPQMAKDSLRSQQARRGLLSWFLDMRDEPRYRSRVRQVCTWCNEESNCAYLIWSSSSLYSFSCNRPEVFEKLQEGNPPDMKKSLEIPDEPEPPTPAVFSTIYINISWLTGEHSTITLVVLVQVLVHVTWFLIITVQ